MSSKELVKVIEKGGGVFVRQGPTDHAIYSRTIEGKRYFVPVQMGAEVARPRLLQEGSEAIKIRR